MNKNTRYLEGDRYSVDEPVLAFDSTQLEEFKTHMKTRGYYLSNATELIDTPGYSFNTLIKVEEGANADWIGNIENLDLNSGVVFIEPRVDHENESELSVLTCLITWYPSDSTSTNKPPNTLYIHESLREDDDPEAFKDVGIIYDTFKSYYFGKLLFVGYEEYIGTAEGRYIPCRIWVLGVKLEGSIIEEEQTGKYRTASVLQPNFGAWLSENERNIKHIIAVNNLDGVLSPVTFITYEYQDDFKKLKYIENDTYDVGVETPVIEEGEQNG